MVPHVTTAEEARHIVEITRFHPLGRRAVDGGNVDGAYCQVPIGNYLEHSNRERVLIFQIESPEALENVEKIAAVPGFEMLLFGPGDFSHLIGKAGEINAPEVVAARKRVGAAAHKHGKFAMSAGLIAPRDQLEEEGYSMFNLGADVIGLGHYAKELMTDFRKPAAAVNPPLVRNV
jgi:4-hydroxy-2-oxoheptanedioate aldolase